MTAPHGIKGLLKIELVSDRPHERFAPGSSVVIEGTEYTVSQFSKLPKGYLLGVREVSSREAAELLRGAEITAARNESKLGEDEYFHDDLLGFAAETENGRSLGVLRQIITTGANDVFEIGTDQRTYLVPAIKDVVIVIDTNERRIVVREIEGLLE